MIDVKKIKKGDTIWYASSDMKKIFVDDLLVVDNVVFFDVEPSTNGGIIIIDNFRNSSKMYRVSVENTFDTKIEAEIFAAINLIKRYNLLDNDRDKKIIYPYVMISQKVVDTYLDNFSDLIVFHTMKYN